MNGNGPQLCSHQLLWFGLTFPLLSDPSGAEPQEGGGGVGVDGRVRSKDGKVEGGSWDLNPSWCILNLSFLRLM